MTEPKVVRYECWCSNKEVDPVEMVRYSDYASLAARMQELEEYVEQLTGEIRDLIELEGLP